MASHIDDSCQLLAQTPHVRASAAALWVLPVVKDREAVAQEIGPEGGKRIEPGQKGTCHLSFQNPSHNPPVQEQGVVCALRVSVSCAPIQASLEGRVFEITTNHGSFEAAWLRGSVVERFFACPRLSVQSPAARKTAREAVTAALGRCKQKTGTPRSSATTS